MPARTIRSGWMRITGSGPSITSARPLRSTSRHFLVVVNSRPRVSIALVASSTRYMPIGMTWGAVTPDCRQPRHRVHVLKVGELGIGELIGQLSHMRLNHPFAMDLQSALVDAHEPHRLPPESLELRELRYFLVVAEELNFTRAARVLPLAQQGLSAVVRKLEADLGVQLLTRSTRHVALASAGEALVLGARHVLETAAEAVDEVRRIAAGRGGRLIVGFSTATGAVPQSKAAHHVP